MNASLSWRRLYVAALILLCPVLPAKSDDAEPPARPNPAAATNPVPPARWSITAECQMVVLPQKLALPLIPDLSDDAKIEVAWSEIQQMIEHDKATLAANLRIHGDSGKRMVAESVQEVRYATEFTPPQLPETAPGKNAAEVLKHWPHVGIVPTAFETRDVGATLALETRVSEDGQWISLDVEPQHVRLVKFAKFDAGVMASGEHLSVEQPYFSVLKDTLAMHIRAGQRILLGIHQVPGEEDKMELFFLRVQTEHIGNPK